MLAIVLFGYPFHKAEALSLSPVRLELKGNPGDTITEEILLTNETSTPQTFYSSFANFEAQGETGNPSFVDPKEGLGTWMNIVSSVVLPPNASKEVPFSIKIPNNAEPGGHFAVVFFGDTPKEKTDQLAIGSQTGVLVLLSVNGEVKQGGGVTQFNLKDNKHFYNTLPVGFEYKFQNSGNDRIKPEGFLRIRNTFFLLAKKLDGNPVEGNILPNSTRKFDLTWVNQARETDYVEPVNPLLDFFDDVKYQWKNFSFGLYSASLDLSFSDLKFDEGKRLFFFVFPWQLLIVVFVVLMLVYFGGGKLLKRYNQHIIKKARAGNQLPS